MNFRKNLLAALTAAVVAIGLWLFYQSAMPPPVTSMGPAATARKSPQTSALAAPVSPPAAKPGAPSVAVSPDAVAPAPHPDSAADPQAELITAFADIARMYRANDLLQFWQTYTAPEQWAKDGNEQTQRILQVQANTAANPGILGVLQKMDEVFAQGYDALASQTPTYNDAGDEATYTLILDFGVGRKSTEPWTFIKINGKWYLKPVNGN